MAKVLSVADERACIGCGLCVLASAKKISGKYSLADSPIIISKNRDGLFSIDIDDAYKHRLAEIVSVCPVNCFEVTEEI
jgi:NAD-dependent dihydropyrimidine dehydrogenase PreA subunit